MQVISWNHTIITYEEAIFLWLLGEKEYPYYKDEHWDIVIPSRDNPQKVEPVKESPSEDNLVEKIMEEMYSNMSKVEIRSILQKHLSSK